MGLHCLLIWDRVWCMSLKTCSFGLLKKQNQREGQCHQMGVIQQETHLHIAPSSEQHLFKSGLLESVHSWAQKN